MRRVLEGKGKRTVLSSKISEKIVTDIHKETISFQPNYDDSTKEPTVLPAQFPNLLVNGASGIAVGMATNIAPHNLGEVIDATLHCIDNPHTEIIELNNHPWFIGVQFHPEFKSRPLTPHPLFSSFIKAAKFY